MRSVWIQNERNSDMTSYQWNIMVILCKIILRILEVGTANTIVSEEDKNSLRQAVIRSGNHELIE